MAGQFRKLNTIGIGRFREFLRDGAVGPAPLDLLTNIETSAPLSHKISPGTGDFADRHMFGIYLKSLLKDFDPQAISGDAGLWDGLALHWFDRLAPMQSNGQRTLRKEYHYLLSSDYRHYYRHLVRSPWQLVRIHGEAARFVLIAPRESAHPLSVHGEILEQMGGRQQVLGSRSIMKAANSLYLDPAKGRPRTGVAGNSRGSARRFGMVLRQLDLTYDPAGMEDGAFIGALPTEFDRWMKKQETPKDVQMENG